MFGVNGAEALVLLLVVLVVVGPERLPAYAEQLGRWVRVLRDFTTTARSRVAEEMGEDVRDVDWAALDPRRYDPRRIVREALLDEPPAAQGRRYTSGARERAGSPAAGPAAARRRGVEGATAGVAAAGAVGAAGGVDRAGGGGAPTGPRAAGARGAAPDAVDATVAGSHPRDGVPSFDPDAT